MEPEDDSPLPRSWSEIVSESSKDSSLKLSKLSISGAGGHDYQFVEEPPKDLKCSICLSVFRDPHLTSCCGNHYCQTCINLIQVESKPCPLCQQVDFNSMLDKGICRKVNELHVQCLNVQEGCQWTGELKSVQVHIDSQCEFVQVRCSLCLIFVLKTYLAEHKSIACPKRNISCEDCGYQSTWEVVTSGHRSVCPNRTLPCPNKCSIGNVKRKDMEEHLNTHCPLLTMPCDFQFAGCEELTQKKDAIKHNEENVVCHLSLLAKKFNSELSKKEEEIKSLQATIRNQKEQMHKLNCPESLLPKDLYMYDFTCYQSTSRWFSEPFYSHPNGYKMCLSVYPNGTGKGTGSHLSVFVNLMRSEHDDDLSWPFQGKITVTLVTDSQVFEETLYYTDKAPASAAQRVINCGVHKVGQGKSQFVELRKLGGCNCLHFRVVDVEFTSV